MIFRNINPELTSETLASAGFTFDGYYYVNPKYLIKFNKVEGGFAPSMEENLPGMSQVVLKTYVDFIKLLQSVLQLTILKSTEGKKFLSPDQHIQYVAGLIEEYWSFDEMIGFQLMVNPQAGTMNMIPSNEYTHTITSGIIKEFIVVVSDKNPEIENTTFELEIDPACISWPFLVNYMRKELGFEDKEITSVFMRGVQIDGQQVLVPFFGTGIQVPKPVKSEDTATE